MPKFQRPDTRKERKRGKKEVELWQKRLELSEAKLKKAGTTVKGKGDWETYINLYRGLHWKKGEGGSAGTWHRITSNLVKSNIDALRPQLFFNNPKVKIKLKNPQITPTEIPQPDGSVIPPGAAVATINGKLVDASLQVELLEAIDNYYLGEMSVKSTMRRIINDALVLPYGVGKLEWTYEMEEIEVVVSVNEKTGKETTEKREVVLWQKPSFIRIKPWQFLWDAETDEFDIDSSRWVAEVKFLSKTEMEADPFMENLKDLGKAEFEVTGGVDGMFNGEETPEQFKRWKVYEIHDLKNDRLIVWVSGSEKFQQNRPHPYSEVEGSVYIALGFNLDINSAFPLALPAQIASKVKARNWILSYMTNHIARFNRKYKMLVNTADPAEKERFERGDDGTIIEVSNMGGGPEPIKDAPVTVDMYNLEAILKTEVTEEIGVSAFQRAGREPGVETATEANKIQAGADVKTEEKRDIVKDFMISLVRKMNQILKVYVDEPIATEILGQQGTQWIEWSKADIQGEFIEDVDIYSGMPFSVLEDRRQALEMFSLTQADPIFDAIEVRKELVRRMGWNERLIKSPEQVQAEQEQAAAQEQQLAQEEAQSSTASNIRPSTGAGERAQQGPDFLASLLGQANRGGG